jgi:hypothetical protein
VFGDALALTVFDDEHSEFEERWFTLGMSSTGKLLAVSHTFTATGPSRRGSEWFLLVRPREPSAGSMRMSHVEGSEISR